MAVETKKKKRTVIFQPLPYPVPESTTEEKQKIVYVVAQRPPMPMMPQDPITFLIMLPFMPLFILMQMLSQMQAPFPQGMMPRRVVRRKEYLRDTKTGRIIEEYEEYEVF